MIYLTIICVAQVIAFGAHLWLTSRERAMLLQRIQAPDVAVAQHQIASLPPSPPAVPFDDDESYHRVQNATREDLAAALERR